MFLNVTSKLSEQNLIPRTSPSNGIVYELASAQETSEGVVVARLTELSRSVEGRVVLITGAGGGQGRSTAHLFADEGAHVAVTDLGQSEVDAVVAEIVDAGGVGGGVDNGRGQTPTECSKSLTK